MKILNPFWEALLQKLTDIMSFCPFPLNLHSPPFTKTFKCYFEMPLTPYFFAGVVAKASWQDIFLAPLPCLKLAFTAISDLNVNILQILNCAWPNSGHGICRYFFFRKNISLQKDLIDKGALEKPFKHHKFKIISSAFQKKERIPVGWKS